jgi:hypothetical protein
MWNAELRSDVRRQRSENRSEIPKSRRRLRILSTGKTKKPSAF